MTWDDYHRAKEDIYKDFSRSIDPLEKRVSELQKSMNSLTEYLSIRFVDRPEKRIVEKREEPKND